MKKIFSWLGGRQKAPFEQAMLPTPPGPMAELQLELTRLALQVAKENYARDLDFTHDSIQVVETILADIHHHYERTKSDEGMNGLALEFGAYIATTIQHRLGEGMLERDHPEIGEATFPFTFSGGTIFPYGWCAKRIFDGDADNVWIKYRALVLAAVNPRA